MTYVVVMALCNQAEAFASDLADGQSRYLLLNFGCCSWCQECYSATISTMLWKKSCFTSHQMLKCRHYNFVFQQKTEKHKMIK